MSYLYITVPIPNVAPVFGKMVTYGSNFWVERALYSYEIPTDRLPLVTNAIAYRIRPQYAVALPKDAFGYFIKTSKDEIFRLTDVDPSLTIEKADMAVDWTPIGSPTIVRRLL